METQDLRTLRILEAVDGKENPSQRDLARKLNISLGLVNSFVKRLVNKGYFKITHIPRNRVRYILTPKGAAEKTRLTYAYVTYSIGFYRQARKRMHELFQQLDQQGIRDIAFYGVSDLAEIGYLSLQETQMRLVAIFDDEKAGGRFLGGLKISGIDDINRIKFNRLIVTSVESRQDDFDRALKVGVDENIVLFAI